jgi:hypothetical protein
MDHLRQIAYAAVYHEAGILPIHSMHTSAGDAFEKMPPEEAYRMKRKFRKMWRKLARNALADVNVSRSLSVTLKTVERYGLGEAQPTPSQLAARKLLVASAMYSASDELVRKMREAQR